MAAIIQISFIVAFVVFYRTKRLQWSKMSQTSSEMVDMAKQREKTVHRNGTMSEVTFRSVYDVRPGTVRGLNLNFPSNSRCHVASLFENE